VPLEIVAFHPFVSHKVHGYTILCQTVEDAESMASSHEMPHKGLDPLVPNEVDHFLYTIM